MIKNFRKILIVEDEPIMRDVGERILRRRLSTNIMTVDNGVDAINTAKIISYDLILLDLNIPVCDGWEVLDEIRKFSEVKILLVSGMDKGFCTPDQINKIDTLTSGLINKPFNISDLILEIAAAIGEDVPIDPVCPEPDNLKGPTEAKEIVHELNDIHATMRISCEGYFYSKERGYFTNKSRKKAEHLEVILTDIIDSVEMATDVVKKIKSL